MRLALRPRVLATLAAAALALAGRRAGAQAPAAGPREITPLVLPDAGAWLAEPGRAGWFAGRALGLGWPLVQAGLARGAWSFEDPVRPPEGRPFPGLVAALPPLSGYDSLEVVAGGTEGAGPERPLAALRAVPGPGAAGKPRAIFRLVNGDFGRDETALTAERGGDAGRIHLEALSANRGVTGPYGEEGRHRWSVFLARRLGPGELSGSFRQAGLAARLQSGEEQTARGGSGRVDWKLARGRWSTALGASRQWDSHESFGVTLDPYSRRDAQEVAITGAVEHTAGTRRLGLEARWNRGRVARADTAFTAARHDDAWGTARFTSFGVAQTLAAEVGAGRIGATGALEVAPAVRLARSFGPRKVELWAGRLLEPVWSDVARRGAGFLQSTWAASLDARHRGRTLDLEARALGGRTRDRAVISRLPLEEQWLRAGIRRDPEPWQFVELWGAGRWTRGGFALGAEGVGLVKNGTAIQARVDPDWTARAFGEWGFRAFQGDLGLRFRIQGDAIGARDTDEAAPRPLDGYLTASAGVGLEIGDVVVTLRALNLENQRREDVWIDGRTGLPALGTPRELRVAVTWKLNN